MNGIILRQAWDCHNAFKSSNSGQLEIGGSIEQWLAYLLLDPDASDSNCSSAVFFQRKHFWSRCQLTAHCFCTGRLNLNLVDQTHPVLAIGKFVHGSKKLKIFKSLQQTGNKPTTYPVGFSHMLIYMLYILYWWIEFFVNGHTAPFSTNEKENDSNALAQIKISSTRESNF